MQLQMGQPAEALALYQLCLDIRRPLAQGDPANAPAQRNLAVTHEKVGNVQLRLRQPSEALASHQISLEIRRRLAQADPDSAPAQRDLSFSHLNLGEVQLARGQTQEALASYQSCVDIRRRLAQADPGKVQAQRDLLVGYQKMGTTHQRLGNFHQAVEWYNQALDVAKGVDRPQVFENQVASLRQGVTFCQAADKGLADPESALLLPAPLRGQVLVAVLLAHARNKQADKCLAAADLLAKQDDADARYNAACGYALCVPLADGASEKERRGARAVALLREAIGKGYSNLDHLQKDTDLDALRQRDDYRQLIQTFPKDRKEKP
jgi:tetratricopeptide (TPR) repeat protein